MNTITATKESERRVRNYGLLIFSIFVIAYFFVYFQRISISVVGSDIEASVGGSAAILSAVYYWTYTAMQIPSGLLADRFGPRKSGFVFLMLASVGSFVTSFGNSFGLMVAGKIMIAAGMAIIYIPLMKLVSVWFRKTDFAVLNGITIAVGNFGAIVAGGPLRMLADAIGWREVFLVLGIVTMCLAALCLLIVRDHPHDKNLPSVEEIGHDLHGEQIIERSDAKIPTLKGLRIVFSGGRAFWTCAIAYFLVYGSIMTFQGTWAVRYFDNVYEFAISASWMVTVMGLGKIISTVFIGILTSRGIIHSKRRIMIFGCLCYTLIWAIIFLFVGKIDSYWFWMLISTMFGLFGGFMSLSFTQVKEWYPIAISGTAVSGMNIFLFLGASVCTTISSAVISVSSQDSFSAMWGLMLIFAVTATVLMYLSKEKKPEDKLLGSELLSKTKNSKNP